MVGEGADHQGSGTTALQRKIKKEVDSPLLADKMAENVSEPLIAANSMTSWRGTPELLTNLKPEVDDEVMELPPIVKV